MEEHEIDGEIENECLGEATLYSGFMETFANPEKPIIYRSPQIRMAQEEGFLDLESLSNRDFRFTLIGGLMDVINAHVLFVDEKEPIESDVLFYKLYPSKRKMNGGQSENTFYQDFSTWVEGKVFISPNIQVEESSLGNGSKEGSIKYKTLEELSNRPYRFNKDFSNAEASVLAQVVYLDKREPREYSILLSKLLSSKQMPSEEVARRMKKKEAK
ncbi:MAG: hypothetical protein Q7S74_06590 [Nanoarchaeota archaeon]|nr:hypothetical protein [Nanoarchaeota archaeon]